MNVHDGRSVEALRSESERTRMALTHTVGQLRDKVNDTASEIKTRVSPEHIKSELKDYVRESGESAFRSLERKARDNPLQAVAVGAALAYPLWGLVRAIPAPIMLVGAGLWFASKGGKSSVEAMKAKVGEFAETTPARLSELAASAQAAAGSTVTQVANAVIDARTSLSSEAGSVADTAKASASDIRESVAGIGQAALDTLTTNAANATEAVSQTVSGIKDGAVKAAEQSRTVFVDLIERNPMLVAGVGLAIGAFIAASLPPSNTENRLFGERSDDLKDKAREAASQGVERAKNIAADVAGEVASTAAREGLNADGLKRAVDGLTESVKAVADRGIRTALGSEIAGTIAPQQRLGNGDSNERDV